MSAALLELHEIGKTFFGIHALRGVSLTIAQGHVLGLIGQNGAGKSTLMNIIGGVIQPDTGSMRLADQPYQPRNPGDAHRVGIAFIHQELNLLTNLSIAENIFIGDFPRRRPFGTIDRKTLNQKTRDLLAQVDVQLAPETLVERLSPGERQLVEIARALHLDARLMIFDEPTSSLTTRETEKLFQLIQRLREAGKTIIYISHILADVVKLSDEIAVLRDGELVDSGSSAQFDVQRMITLMIGRSIEQLYPTRTPPPKEAPALTVRQLSQRGIVKDIDFTLAQGEVLGLFGLMGSGRTELARILFGLDEFETGEVIVQGQVMRQHSARASIRHHMAFVTENRRDEGLLMNLAIAENIGLAALPNFAVTPLQFVEQARLMQSVEQMAGSLQLKAQAIDLQTAKSLSGGNQQKVVLAKWLLANPSIFILDEPTRGVDVGAKYEIYSIINTLAAQGAGILFISSELEELIGMCDRILVMNQGEIVGVFERTAFRQDSILRAAFREGSDPNET
jgi:ribose transport system ATP-binding protein